MLATLIYYDKVEHFYCQSMKKWTLNIFCWKNYNILLLNIKHLWKTIEIIFLRIVNFRKKLSFNLLLKRVILYKSFLSGAQLQFSILYFKNVIFVIILPQIFMKLQVDSTYFIQMNKSSKFKIAWNILRYFH